jgi:putative flippase GtrA
LSATIRRIWNERASIVRFLTTGVVGALLNVGLFDVLSRGLDVDYRIAVVLAFAFSYLFTFVAHRTWTFSATDGHVGHQGVRFVVVSAVSIICALIVTVVAVEALGLPKNAGEAASALLTAPVAFVLHRRYTFVGVAAAPEEPAPMTAPTPEHI